MIIQWQYLFYDVTSCRSLTGIIGMGGIIAMADRKFQVSEILEFAR